MGKIEECLENYFGIEKLEEYKCDGYKMENNILQKNWLLHYPQFLILSFKRFNNKGEKIEHLIDFLL